MENYEELYEVWDVDVIWDLVLHTYQKGNIPISILVPLVYWSPFSLSDPNYLSPHDEMLGSLYLDRDVLAMANKIKELEDAIDWGDPGAEESYSTFVKTTRKNISSIMKVWDLLAVLHIHN